MSCPRGGQAVGTAERCVAQMRQRLQGFDESANLQTMQTWFRYASHPMLQFMIGSFGATFLQTKTAEALADLFFECFKIAVSRTRRMKRFAKILDDDDEWKSF